MNNLMQELMAEAARVKALEIEVDRSVNDIETRVYTARKEKLAEIVSFLREINNLFRETCPGKKMIVHTAGEYNNGNHKWSNCLEFGRRDVWLGIYFIGSGVIGHEINITKDPDLWDSFTQNVESFIDKWSDESKSFVERTITNKIREVLTSRIEIATKTLKDANDKATEYFGKEGDAE